MDLRIGNNKEIYWRSKPGVGVVVVVRWGWGVIEVEWGRGGVAVGMGLWWVEVGLG